MTYSEKLKDPKWQKKRLEILNRDKFTCRLCNDKETTLHVHHNKYSNNPWDTDIDDLITLCCDCHDTIEFIAKKRPFILECLHDTTTRKVKFTKTRVLFIIHGFNLYQSIFNYNGELIIRLVFDTNESYIEVEDFVNKI